MLHARNLCSRYGHDGAGDVAVSATGDIATGRRHGNQALARNQAGDDFHLHFLHGFPLALGKAAHVIVGERDIVFEFLTHLRRGGGNVFLVEHQRAVVLVELGRIRTRN